MNFTPEAMEQNLPMMSLSPELGVVEEHVVPLKAGGIDGIVVVGVVAHGDIGGGDHIFQKARGLELVGEDRVGIWDI